MAAGWQLGGWQSKIAGRNCVATFLGDSDNSIRADCHVLHDARTDTRDREGKSATDVLRADASTASLSALTLAGLVTDIIKTKTAEQCSNSGFCFRNDGDRRRSESRFQIDF